MSRRWYAQLQSEYPIQKLLNLAANKLTGVSKGHKMKECGRYALLSCRLLIHKTQNQAGQYLSKALVASGMSIALIPSPSRFILHAGYPPEPFLSAAAVRRMPKAEEWVRWLRDMIVADYVSRGDRGELISRVLLTMARDLAHKEEMERIQTRESQEPDLTSDSILPGHEPVPLCDFLRHFVGHEEWDVVADARPVNMCKDDINSKTLKDFLGERAVVDFTCFGVAQDDHAFTYEGMVIALCQGAAIVCRPNEKIYDSLIIFLLDRNKGFAEDNLGLILVQDKNRKTRANPVLDPTKLPCGTKFPIISILHQPAQQPPGGERRVMAEPPKTKQSARLHKGDDSRVPPIYKMSVYGSRLIEDEILRELLNADDPLQCHRAGSALATDAQAIVEHNRFYAVPSAEAASRHVFNKDFDPLPTQQK
jgi:hypothetical protein